MPSYNTLLSWAHFAHLLLHLLWKLQITSWCTEYEDILCRLIVLIHSFFFFLFSFWGISFLERNFWFMAIGSSLQEGCPWKGKPNELRGMELESKREDRFKSCSWGWGPFVGANYYWQSYRLVRVPSQGMTEYASFHGRKQNIKFWHSKEAEISKEDIIQPNCLYTDFPLKETKPKKL